MSTNDVVDKKTFNSHVKQIYKSQKGLEQLLAQNAHIPLPQVFKPGDIIKPVPIDTNRKYYVVTSTNVVKPLPEKRINIATKFDTATKLAVATLTGGGGTLTGELTNLELSENELGHLMFMVAPGFDVYFKQPNAADLFHYKNAEPLNYRNTTYFYERGDYGQIPTMYILSNRHNLNYEIRSTDLNSETYDVYFDVIGWKYTVAEHTALNTDPVYGVNGTEIYPLAKAIHLGVQAK